MGLGLGSMDVDAVTTQVVAFSPLAEGRDKSITMGMMWTIDF